MAVTCHVMPERKGHAIDCEESLFFLRFPQVRLAHARAQAVNGEAARLEVRGYTSGASSHARGHVRVSRLTFDELRKKRDCS